MRGPILLAVTAALLTTAITVTAGTEEGDFPDRWQDALDVAPGTHAQTVGGGDPFDALRVVHPAGQALRATLVYDARAGAPSLHLSDDAGAPAEVGETVARVGDEVRLSRYGVAPEGLRVGIARGPSDAPVAYALVLEVVDLPDAAVVGLRVREAPLPALGSGAAHPTHRVVEVDVANLGGAPADALLGVFVWGAGDVRSVGRVGAAQLWLEPGQADTRTFVWEGLGAGSVTFSARVLLPPPQDEPPRDVPQLRRDNDGRTTAHHLVAPLPGVGVVVGL